MSRSPRKSLHRAGQALDEFLDVVGRFQDARADVIARIGQAGLDELQAIRARLAEYERRLDSGGSQGVAG